MATEKLSEGIRQFVKDLRGLRGLVAEAGGSTKRSRLPPARPVGSLGNRRSGAGLAFRTAPLRPAPARAGRRASSSA